jgi:hypothetical protein
MPVRLTKAYGGQAANTLYWEADQSRLRNIGLADDNIEAASDYAKASRIVTSATASTSVNATTYRMNSGSAQTLTLNPSGYWPKDSVLTVVQEGLGATTVVGSSGVTIGGSTTTTGQNKVLQLIKGAGETWTGVGG